MTEREKLFEIMYEKSFKYQPEDPFTLVSGKVSPLYFDCKATMLDPKGLQYIGSMVASKIYWLNVYESQLINCIGGLEFGAIPIMLSSSLNFLNNYNNIINPLVIRKEAKSHGTQKWIEGNYVEGDKVMVIDDVITTGGSTVKAIKRMQDAGLEVVHCSVLVDREEFDGKKNIEDLGVPVSSIFTATDFINYKMH